MKKLTFTFVLVMAMMLAKAQITITSSDMPQPGREDIVGDDTVTKMTISQASSSPQTWDFTMLQNNYPKFAIYSPTTPYQAYAPSFTGSNIYTWGPSYFFTSFYGSAPVYSNDYGYMYWKTDTAGFHIVGFRGNMGGPYGYENVVEGPQELLMGTPATLNSTFANSARWEVSYDLNHSLSNYDTNYISKRKKTLTVDAYGTMTTPYITTPINVIRVHEYITDQDSLTSVMGTTTVYSLLYYSDTLNNYQFWAKGIHYPVAIVHCDKNNKVMSTEFLDDTLPVYSVTGKVYNNLGTTKVKAGTANLILRDSWAHLFDWLETVNIDTNGNFQFADVADLLSLGAGYLVQANPDTAMYPYLMPTYSGDSTTWQTANPIYVNSDTNITVDCQSDSLLATTLTGSGSMSGSVWVDTSKGQGMTVARGVKVVLVENPGGACSIRHTDNNGQYSFDNLPSENFKLIVDIPGLYMDSTYYVLGSTKTSSFTNLDFRYDTTKIYIYEGAGIEKHNINSMYDVNIYPNPFNNLATIYVSNPNGENRIVTFTLYDVAGRVIKEMNAGNSEYLSLSSEDLSKGMYIYEIRVNNEIVNTGKVVVN